MLIQLPRCSRSPTARLSHRRALGWEWELVGPFFFLLSSGILGFLSRILLGSLHYVGTQQKGRFTPRMPCDANLFASCIMGHISLYTVPLGTPRRLLSASRRVSWSWSPTFFEPHCDLVCNHGGRDDVPRKIQGLAQAEGLVGAIVHAQPLSRSELE